LEVDNKGGRIELHENERGSRVEVVNDNGRRNRADDDGKLYRCGFDLERLELEIELLRTELDACNRPKIDIVDEAPRRTEAVDGAPLSRESADCIDLRFELELLNLEVPVRTALIGVEAGDGSNPTL